MDKAGMRRAGREAALAGVVVLVVACCGLVAAAALVAPWVSGWGEPLDNVCRGVTPRVVIDDMIAGGHEGSGATATRSWVPYGARCTWTTSDGSAVTRAPSWDSTLAVLGALAGAAGALWFLSWSARRAARAVDKP